MCIWNSRTHPTLYISISCLWPRFQLKSDPTSTFTPFAFTKKKTKNGGHRRQPARWGRRVSAAPLVVRHVCIKIQPHRICVGGEGNVGGDIAQDEEQSISRKSHTCWCPSRRRNICISFGVLLGLAGTEDMLLEMVRKRCYGIDFVVERSLWSGLLGFIRLVGIGARILFDLFI